MSAWVLLVNGLGTAICITITIEVFRNESLDVTSVAWHVLLPGFFIWAADPVLGKPTAIAENDFVTL